MELLLRLAALSLCVSALALLLRSAASPLALLLTAAAVLVGCGMLLSALTELSDFLSRALALTELPESLFLPLLKVVAIALVARFASALCADAGQSALASLLQTAGAASALLCALPLLTALLTLVEEYL